MDAHEVIEHIREADAETMITVLIQWDADYRSMRRAARDTSELLSALSAVKDPFLDKLATVLKRDPRTVIARNEHSLNAVASATAAAWRDALAVGLLEDRPGVSMVLDETVGQVGAAARAGGAAPSRQRSALRAG